MLRATNKLIIRKLLVHPTGPTSNLPQDKVEEDGNCLAVSQSDLKIQNLPWVWNLGGTSKSRLTEKYLSVRGMRSFAMGHLRKEHARGVPRIP